MANTVIDALQKGRGRLEYIWHAGGIPWAVATSRTIISGLSSAHRQAMFGASVYSDGAGGSIYFADEVDIYPFLEVPGAIKIKSKEGIAELDGGDLTIKILNKPVVPTWPHGTRTIHGLEGLQAVANPRQDSDVFVANLAAPLEKTETTIEVENDVGGHLSNACEESLGQTDPIFLWIGGECMACWSGDGAIDPRTCETQTSWRGLLNSKLQSFWPNVSNQPNIRVTNYPLNGIVSRPWYLWAFLLDTDGTILDGPFRMHHGKIGNDISSDGAFWSVQCLPWWKWLDTDLDVASVQAKMAKYTFSRGDSIDEVAHMQFKEFDWGSDDWHDTWEDVWLCSENSTVTFDTLSDLNDAICSAMTTASVEGWDYYSTPHGPYSDGSGGNPAWFRARGALPVLMGWRGRGVDLSYNSSFVDAGNEIAISNRVTGKACLNLGDDDHQYLTFTNVENECLEATPPEYILQWGNFAETTPWPPHCNLATPLFPIPLDESGYTTPRVYVDESTANVAEILANSYLEIGTEAARVNRGGAGPLFANTTQTPTSTLCKAKIKAVGAGIPGNNYIDLTSEAPDLPEYAGTYISLVGQAGVADPADGTFKFLPGTYLFYRPDIHETDPWPLLQSFNIEAEKLGELFRAILGDTTSPVTVDEQIQADHIPDIDAIDWDLIDDLIEDTDIGTDPGQEFRIRYNGTLNLWKMLNQELRFYALSPTWEPIHDDDEFRMRVRRGGLINGTVAETRGRLIDQHVVATGQTIKAEQAADMQYNQIALSANWNPVEEKWGGTFTFNDRSGLAPTGGKNNTLKIEPKITRILDLDVNEAALRDYFAAVLDQYMHPRPAQSAKATLRSSMDLGVGTLCLITLDNVQDPFDGTIGLTEWPAVVTERTFDAAKGQAAYKWELAFDKLYGWTPTLKITTSSDSGSNVVTVTDIDGSGQLYSGDGASEGWYDHWWFADLEYNQTMTAPVSGGGGNYFVKLWLAESPWTIIDEVECYDVSTGTYAAVTGAAGAFFRLTSAGLSAAYDDAKEYYMTFVSWDSANITDEQRRFTHIADDDLELVDSASDAIMGRAWK